MAEFVKVMRAYDRMCKSFDECSDCPASVDDEDCMRYHNDELERFEEIVLAWAAEHSEPKKKTMKEALLEILPNVRCNGDLPHNCPRDYFGGETEKTCKWLFSPNRDICTKCWNRPAPDEYQDEGEQEDK